MTRKKQTFEIKILSGKDYQHEKSWEGTFKQLLQYLRGRLKRANRFFDIDVNPKNPELLRMNLEKAERGIFNDHDDFFLKVTLRKVIHFTRKEAKIPTIDKVLEVA